MNVQPSSQNPIPDRPTGMVTFLFTDIEGSTDLLRKLGDKYTILLSDHRQILRSAFVQHQGREIDTQGDSFFVAFKRLSQAIAAAVQAQHDLAEYCGPQGCRVRVRMGLHTGEPLTYGEGYTGLAVHRAARIAHAGHGGQVLLSAASAALAQEDLVEGHSLKDLGLHCLKDMPSPEHIFQLVIPGLPTDFPPVHSEKEIIRQLPAFLGEDIEIRHVPPFFVAREGSLSQLNTFLEKALNGTGSVAFVAGSPGAGKTALLYEFSRRSMLACPDLLVASGGCNQYSGAGDAYLPWREIMGMLAGDVETRWAGGAISTEHARRLWTGLPDMVAALLKRGPHLYETFLSGEVLLAHLAAALPQDELLLGALQDKIELQARGAGGMEQSHILEQVTGVLLALAEKHPLLLVLDDLQWADDSSLSLLFHVGRRLEGARILVVGAYRPEEVALGRQGQRHPLEKVLLELQRVYGEPCLDLSEVEQAESQQFVQAFLDSEPNRLDQAFREALLKHTEGHPLFTIELLRALQRGDDLVQDQDGCWVLGASLDWEQMPSRVEAVIEERICHLDAQLRSILEVASVEGEDFTARVVAGIQEVVESRLLHLLSAELEKRHRLVHETVGIQLENSLLSRYRFAHSLFQRYLYNSLGEGERRLLHHQVAATLESLFAGHTEQIAEQLAYHYAGNPERERHYCRLAGERAAARYANAEARRYFSRALELTPEEDLEERFELFLKREAVLDLLGEAQDQQYDLEQLQQLAGNLGDDRRSLQVLRRLAGRDARDRNYPAVLSSARRLIRLGKSIGDVESQAEGYRFWGAMYCYQVNQKAADRKFKQALKLARPAGLKRVEAGVLRLMGSGLEAIANCEQAVDIYHELGDRSGETQALNSLGALAANYSGDCAKSITYFETALAISQEIGHRRMEGFILINLAEIHALIYNFPTAEAQLEQALRISHENESWLGEVHVFNTLFYSFILQGNFPQAHDSIQRALAITLEHENRSIEIANKGRLIFMFQATGENSAAMELAREVFDYAKESKNEFFQAFASASMAYACEANGDLDQAVHHINQALDLRLDTGEPVYIVECQAGLARLRLAAWDTAGALSYLEKVLEYREAALLNMTPLPGKEWIHTDPFDATLRTFELYLTCYRVLKAAGDPRAGEILRYAHNLLMERSERIEDPEKRQTFLTNVRANREILAAWEKEQEFI